MRKIVPGHFSSATFESVPNFFLNISVFRNGRSGKTDDNHIPCADRRLKLRVPCLSRNEIWEILGQEASSILDELLSQGLIYCDPSRELNFWRPTPSALLALGLRSSTDIPALKELEEWFDAHKEIRGIAELDPFFERTGKLASRRLKREIERRGTLGEFALEPDPSTKRIPPEESSSDLFRSDEPDGVGGSGEVESAQSVVQGCPAQGSAVGWGKGVETGPIGKICGRAAAGPAGPGAPSRHAKSARRQRSMVPRPPCPTAALRGPQF
jgi:hypothetical protein